MSCNHLCNQGRSCTCAFPLATGQGIKSPKSATNPDDLSPVDGAEAAILWLIATVGVVICVFFVVQFLIFIGV